MQHQDTRKTKYNESGITRGSDQQEKKSYRSLWILGVLVFLTGSVFLIPEIRLNTKFDFTTTWWFDALQHIFFYLTFTLILFRLLHFQERSLSFFLFLLCFATFFEVLQKIIYNIYFEWLDAVSNLIGISLAFGIGSWMESKQRKKRRLNRMRRKSSYPGS
jgi:VanZ family protein